MIEMCYFYTTTGYPQFKPRCKVGLRASLKCHSKNNCPAYMVVLDEFANYPRKEVEANAEQSNNQQES